MDKLDLLIGALKHLQSTTAILVWPEWLVW